MNKEPTNGKCLKFVNAHCSYDCPNAALESACDRFDLDPSDFGMEFLDCNECLYDDECCTCNDCYMQGNTAYCPRLEGEKEVAGIQKHTEVKAGDNNGA